MLGNNIIRKCNLRVHIINQQEIVQVNKNLNSLGCFGVTWMHDLDLVVTAVLQLTAGQLKHHEQYLVRLVEIELSCRGSTRLCFDSRQRQMSGCSAKATHILRHMTRSDP